MPPGPDLAFARIQYEKLMEDGVLIHIDHELNTDGTFDPVTGQITDPPNDSQTLFDETSLGIGGRSLAHYSGLGGMCLITPVQTARSIADNLLPGVNVVRVPYQIEIPVDAPDVTSGALIDVLVSRRDPRSIGKRFLVRNAWYTTLALSRVMICEETEHAPS